MSHYPKGWLEAPLAIVTPRAIKIHRRVVDEPWWNDPKAVAEWIRSLVAEAEAKRARRRYVPAKDWARILDAFGHRCAYCGVSGVPLEREHRVPVVKGGGDGIDNIVPACRPCNATKRTDDPADWPLVIIPVWT